MNDQDMRNVEDYNRVHDELKIIRAITDGKLQIFNKSLQEVYNQLDSLGLIKGYACYKYIRLTDLTPDKIDQLEKKLKRYYKRYGDTIFDNDI